LTGILIRDLRFGLRQLRKTPGFTLLVVLTIGLGIGANTAVFSVINGFLRPLPVTSPEQIVVIAANTKGDETGFRYRFSYPVLGALRQQTDIFSDVFAFTTELAGITIEGKTTQFLFSPVTGNCFPALGLMPAAGSLFRRGEGESANSELTLVLGYAYWQKRFGGRADAVGRLVRLDGKTARIIGVAPQGFHGLYAGAEIDGYTPMRGANGASASDYFTARTLRRLTVMGRLKTSLSQAQTSMETVAHRLEQQYPDTDKGIGIRVVPEYLARPMPLHFLVDAVPVVRGFLLVLAGLVLLLACLNVANLMMVRASMRGREMAIRAALGSSRSQLVGQMLTESGLLALAGGCTGLLFAKWGSNLFAGSIHIATDFPVALDFSFDWRVFVYALVGSVVTAVGIGLWPAMRVSRTDANSVLHSGRSDGAAASHPSRQRLRSLLVSAQVAGSLVLLIVAGLFVKSLQRAELVDLGFETRHLVNARLSPRYVGYDEQRTVAFYRELKRRVAALPGVESATVAFSAPMGYLSDSDRLFVEGRTVPPGEQPPVAGSNRVDEDYFSTMRIPVVRGRAFRESDREGAPLVAIVNQTMAARYWPGEEPLGKRFRLGDAAALWEVVGVAHDAKYLSVFEGPLPYFYTPIAQRYIALRVLQVRSQMPAELVRQQVQKAIASLDPDMPVADLQTMTDALEGGPAAFLMLHLGARQAAFMGMLGLVLAIIGVYGVASCGAAQRTHEIGVRMALGAQAGDIMRMILRQGAVTVAVGVTAGLFAAAELTRLAAHWVRIANAADPVVFGSIAIALAAVALLACYVPARRAMRVDPLVALRHE
jgi:macrolide transport system ATP-binding/permease protein